MVSFPRSLDAGFASLRIKIVERLGQFKLSRKVRLQTGGVRLEGLTYERIALVASDRNMVRLLQKQFPWTPELNGRFLD